MEITVTQSVAAAPATTFDHFVEPALLTTWWPTSAEVEAVPGGSYTMEFAQVPATLRGSYRTVDPPSRLVFTWAWDHEDLPSRLVELTFQPDGDSTSVTVTHEAGDSNEADSYRDGWTFFLSRLAALFEE